MPKLISALAFAAATSAIPAASQGLSYQMLCTEADQSMTARVRDVLAHDDSRVAGTAPLHIVLSHMTSARFDCKHGRTERGLQTYAAADHELQAIEESMLARTARSGANDAP